MDTNDFAIYKDGDKYIGGGYTIESYLLNNEQSPITTVNISQDGGYNNKSEKFSDLFDNLVVPAGLFINYQKPNKTQLDGYEEHTMLSDDIYDKLFGLIQMPTKKNTTRRKKTTIKNKKTKRNLKA